MTDLPDITVVTCTNKIGGVDLIKGSLLNQDFPLDRVELILVDDFHHLRKREVAAYLEDAPFMWKHVGPGAERTFNLAANFNKALLLAEGELIVPLEDYEWASSSWLSTHWKVYEERLPDLTEGGGTPASWWRASTVTAHGLTHDCKMPRTKFDSPIQDVRRILLSPKMRKYALISVFPGDRFDPLSIEIEKEDRKWEPYGVQPGELLPRMSTHVYRNVSLPLERALELNGYDEAFDGDDPHHFQIDPTAEVYWRAEVQGHRFLYVEEGPLYHLDHWALFTWDRQADYSYMRSRMANILTRGGPTVAQNMNHHLKVMREREWRTSRARRLYLGTLKDNCRFSLDEEGDSDAAITAKVYRMAYSWIQTDGWVLDDGCGSGEGMDENPRCVGIDISIQALREAREQGHRVVLGDVRKLPFKDGVFRSLLSIETLEHLLEGETYLEEARRVLQPGGYLALSTPDGGPIIGSHLRLYDRRQLAEIATKYFRPVHFEVVDWRAGEGGEDKLFLRGVRE